MHFLAFAGQGFGG